MFNTKFSRYYSAFSAEEAKEWVTFVESPYFNKDQNVVRLAKILRKYHPNLDQKALDKKRLYQRIYGSKDYNDLKMRKLLSAGVKLIERFWVVQGVEGDTIDYQNRLRQAFRKRELNQSYVKVANQLIDTVSSDPQKMDNRLLGDIHLDLYDDQQILGTNKFIPYLTKASEYYYKQECIDQLVRAMSWSEIGRVLNHEPDPKWIKLPALHFPSSMKVSDYALLNELFKLQQQWTSVTEVTLKEFWTKFTYNAYTLSLKSKFVITAICLNISRNLLKADEFGIDLKIELIKWAIPNRSLIFQGNISGSRVFAICMELCASQETKLAKHFLKIHEPHIPTRYRNEIIQLCNAVILLENRNFEDAFYLFSSFEITQLKQYESNRRILLLRSAVEFAQVSSKIGDLIPLFVDRNNKWFRKDKTVSATAILLRINYSNLFLRTHRYLNNVTSNEKVAENILADVENNPMIIRRSKKWFQEKLMLGSA